MVQGCWAPALNQSLLHRPLKSGGILVRQYRKVGYARVTLATYQSDCPGLKNISSHEFLGLTGRTTDDLGRGRVGTCRDSLDLATKIAQ